MHKMEKLIQLHQSDLENQQKSLREISYQIIKLQRKYGTAADKAKFLQHQIQEAVSKKKLKFDSDKFLNELRNVLDGTHW